MESQLQNSFSREEITKQISRLIIQISRLNCNCMNQRLQPMGLTVLSSSHLVNILCRPGMSQNELAGLLSVSKVMVSKTLKQLEKNGWITRIPDEEDKRLVHLYLTPEGERLAYETMETQKEIVCYAMQGLSEQDCIKMESQLQKVMADMREWKEKDWVCSKEK